MAGDSQLGKGGGGKGRGGGGGLPGGFFNFYFFQKVVFLNLLFSSFCVIIFGKCYFHRMLMI